jgi:nitrite reductase/ring-hydroxylating ferredoxin subunit
LGGCAREEAVLTKEARPRVLEPGELAAFDLDGTRVAVANVNGTHYAFNDTCPHLGCSLAHGTLDDRALTCAGHGSQFDVTTGALLRGPATSGVETYRARVKNGELVVRVPPTSRTVVGLPTTTELAMEPHDFWTHIAIAVVLLLLMLPLPLRYGVTPYTAFVFVGPMAIAGLALLGRRQAGLQV